MAIIFYISLLLSPPFLLIYWVKRDGELPKSKSAILLRALPAIPLAFLFVASTIILDSEGGASLVFLFYGINIAIVSAGFRGIKLWILGFFITIFSLFLYSFAFGLAHSPEYTDNPQGRLKKVRAINSTQKRSKPLLPNVEISPEWHTFLTRLYAVHPKS